MDKKKLALLIVIGAIVAYLLLRPKQAAALEQPVTQPVATAPPASPPPPDLGTQLAGIEAQVTAGLGAINTVTTALPAAIPTATAAVSQAVAAAAAIPAQVGTAISTASAQATAAATQLSTAIGTAANTVVSGVATYLPYLGPAAALTIIISGIAQTHREYDPTTKQCCDVGAVGKFNCKWGVWEIMQCLYEVYDFPMSADMKAGKFPSAPGWTREKVVNLIFAELEQLRGKVQAGIIDAPNAFGTMIRYYTPTGLRTLPNLATIKAPNEFRILNPDEQVKYIAIKNSIIADNKKLAGLRQIAHIELGRGNCTTVSYPGGQQTRTVAPCPPTTYYATTSEFNFEWLY